MNISSVIQTVSSAIDSVRGALAPIPGTLMLCTCARRPGFSSILTSAKIYADMHQNENDEILKKFVMNVVDKLKNNLHDDAACWVVIPPGALKFILTGSNAMGPVVFRDAKNPDPYDLTISNGHFIIAYGIIR